MISVRSVSKSFGHVSAVRDVSFEVGRGEVVGLLGANGAGKTTTIRMITGFLPPDAGAISVHGHDTVEDSLAARRCIGYLPESAPAYGEMATDDFLDFRGRLYGLPRAARRIAIDRALELCDLREVRGRRIGQLSRGFRQRVGLASAILHDPPALILDEPTSALDPRQIRQTRSVIRNLAQERAVVVSSHILPEVEKTCDRVVVMARGVVRADATPADLLRRGSAEEPYEIELRIPDAAPAPLGLFQSVAGVARAEMDGSPDQQWLRYRVYATPGSPDLRESLSREAALRGMIVRELHRRPPGLERVFLGLIESDDAPGQERRP
jgi:ABC-2 type transport system ATP-binding protein